MEDELKDLQRIERQLKQEHTKKEKIKEVKKNIFNLKMDNNKTIKFFKFIGKELSYISKFINENNKKDKK